MKEMPKGWEKVQLGTICLDKEGLKRGPFGSAIKKEFFVPDGYKVYEQSNAIYDDAFKGKYFIDEKKYKELINFKVESGDLIVSCSGTLGKITQIPNNAKPGIINQALLRIRLVADLMNKQYFLYFFRSAKFQRKIFAQSQGTAMTNLIGIKDFKEIELLLPPLPEQHRIVAKIEALFSSLDKGIESLKAAQAQLKTYRQAVLKWAFEGKLTNKNVKEGELPEGWKLTELKNVTLKAKKVKVKERDLNEEFIYLDIGGINNSLNKITSHKIYQWKDAPSRAQQIVEYGDTLFSTVRTYLKNIAIIDKDIYHQQIASSGFTVIRADKGKLIPKYLFYYSIYEGFIRPLNELQTGTSYPAVRDEDVFSQPINYPTNIPEQHRIVSEIETRLSVCDKLEESIAQSLVKAEALRQSILKKAFEGKLVPQDPNDLPASVLLERIRAEREKNKPKTRQLRKTGKKR